ncbi:universal stress protein [Nocardiopsis baichengensis]|uniref:universal stress protein n=1 Tax=Nocardiopsis baichengensis TaxID=280240 RepID=UPI00034AFCF9|nr:universal stress protein [Nocardiopsis baichengensis]
MTDRTPEEAAPRIVIGYDGSPPSTAALHWAAREAGLRGCDLWVVRVLSDGRSSRAPYAGATAVTRNGPAVRELRRAADDARSTWPHVYRTAVCDDLPARALARAAAGAELLVLGTRGPAGPGGPSLGPTASACMRIAPCPVVFVGTDRRTGEPARPRRDHPASEHTAEPRTDEPVGAGSGGPR